MILKMRRDITLLLFLALSARVMLSCEGVQHQATLEEAARFMRAFKQAVDIKEQLSATRGCCQLTPAPGSAPAITDTDRDVKEILYSLLVIKSKIEQICRNIETFRENFFDSLNFIVSALYADYSPILCSKVELLELELATHDANVIRLLNQLRDILFKRIAERCENLEKVEATLLRDNKEIAELIKSITVSLDIQQRTLDAQLVKMDVSLSQALKAKVADVQQLSRERFVQTSAALLQMQDKLKKELDVLAVATGQTYETLHDAIAESMNGLTAIGISKGNELIDQLKAIIASLTAQLQGTCTRVGQALTSYENQTCEGIEKTRVQLFEEKAAERATINVIEEKGTAEHRAIKAQATAMGVNTIETLQNNSDEFCAVLAKEVIHINEALNQFERDLFGRIEAEFDRFTRIVEQHTIDGKTDLLSFETHLIRSLARDFCGLDEKIAVGLSDVCSDIVQLDGQIATQSGRINRLLAKIDGNLTGKVCVKMSNIEKDQVLNRNALVAQLGDFRTLGASQICGDIAATQAHLDGQADALEAQALAVEASTRADLTRQLGATEAMLQGYYVSLCSKLGALETGVCTAIAQEFGESDAELSAQLSALYQKSLAFESSISSAISSQFGDLSADILQNEAIICGKIADFRAHAIDNVNKLCEKFSAVKVNTILALSDVEQAILEKLAALDTELQNIAITVSVIAGQAKGLRPLI